MSNDLSLSINNNFCNNLGFAAAVLKFHKEFKDSSIQRTKTSGSTGDPKMIELSRDSMMQSAKNTIDFFGIHEGSNLLLCLPVDFIAGKMMIVRAIAAKANLVIADAVSNPLISFISKKIKLDFAAFTPFQVAAILQEPVTASLFESISTVIIGGGEIPLQLEKKLTGFKNKIYSTYGMTETITHIAVRKVGNPIFKAFKGISLGLDNRDCLTIEADYLPEKIITNDIVSFEGPFEFIFKGRYDHVINSGGIKVHPESVEAKINDLLNVNYFITGQSHPELGQQVVLVIEGNELDPTTLNLLKNSLNEALGKYEIPKKIVFATKFALTPTGKIDRLTTLKQIQ